VRQTNGVVGGGQIKQKGHTFNGTGGGRWGIKKKAKEVKIPTKANGGEKKKNPLPKRGKKRGSKNSLNMGGVSNREEKSKTSENPFPNTEGAQTIKREGKKGSLGKKFIDKSHKGVGGTHRNSNIRLYKCRAGVRGGTWNDST